MKADVLELLTAYLDGEASSQEQTTVQQWLKEDEGIRQEYENMKTFHQQINQTRPGELKVPPDFRTNIMTRLKAMAGPDSGEQAGGSTGRSPSKGWFKQQWQPYLLAGSVLLGLTTFFILQDLSNQQKINQMQVRLDQLQGADAFDSLSLPADTVGRQARQQPTSTKGQHALSASKQDQVMDQTNAAGPVSGKIYHRNQVLPDNRAAYQTASPFTRHLETSQQWTRAIIDRKSEEMGLQDRLDSVQVLDWARQSNLNPGLIISMAQLKPDKPVKELADSIRAIFNQHPDLSNEQRLQKLIQAFGGSSDWEQVIKRNLQP